MPCETDRSEATSAGMRAPSRHARPRRWAALAGWAESRGPEASFLQARLANDVIVRGGCGQVCAGDRWVQQRPRDDDGEQCATDVPGGEKPGQPEEQERRLAAQRDDPSRVGA